eukprot:580070-Pelagomonas_calceolata.AAC.1
MECNLKALDCVCVPATELTGGQCLNQLLTPSWFQLPGPPEPARKLTLRFALQFFCKPRILGFDDKENACNQGASLPTCSETQSTSEILKEEL